ncbi:hypothetical protein AA0242T_2673 [Acetobacter aceti NRIC 0242]|nr:hypothetical protein AA0242T_2673 [Acetobacter aceti NRIC 0242]
MSNSNGKITFPYPAIRRCKHVTDSRKTDPGATAFITLWKTPPTNTMVTISTDGVTNAARAYGDNRTIRTAMCPET